MPSKQQESYTQLKAETEARVQTYHEFEEQIVKLNDTTRQAIDALKKDMKFLVKQIEANNQMLNIQGLEPVKFDK